jgi:hypothetical protein
MAQRNLQLTLAEPKKSCGKYVVNGTENDNYPTFLYLKNEWLGGRSGSSLPREVTILIES